MSSLRKNPGHADVAIGQFMDWLGDFPARAGLQLVSRFGYVARGFVYVTVGAVALLAAIDMTPSAAGPAEAVAAWANWPAGIVLITVVAIGLFAFAAWRALQCVFDTDNQGNDAWGLAVRAGQGISGIVHAALAVSIMLALEAFESISEGEGSASEFLSGEKGDVTLLVAGVFTLGVGAGNLIRALVQDFSKRLGCSKETCRWATILGRVGYAARALVFLMVGFFLIEAARDLRDHTSANIEAAMTVLEQQAYGSVILALTAAGLIAFGLFAFVEARFRKMKMPIQ